jgi:hypothetical protein
MMSTLVVVSKYHNWIEIEANGSILLLNNDIEYVSFETEYFNKKNDQTKNQLIAIILQKLISRS